MRESDEYKTDSSDSIDQEAQWPRQFRTKQEIIDGSKEWLDDADLCWIDLEMAEHWQSLGVNL